MSDAVFRALADPQRRKILKLLQQGSLSAGELAQRFDVSAGTLSYHFNLLKDAGLVLCERQGQRLMYSLNAAVLEELAAMVLDLFQGPQPPGRRAWTR
jgi:DNA-binding transcriptional ArsR family regulator